jgi:predicted transcriptional regulator
MTSTFSREGNAMEVYNEDTRILNVLKSSPQPLTLAEILGRFPRQEWRQLFSSIDRLKRNGFIFRKGREYRYNRSGTA